MNFNAQHVCVKPLPQSRVQAYALYCTFRKTSECVLCAFQYIMFYYKIFQACKYVTEYLIPVNGRMLWFSEPSQRLTITKSRQTF